VIAFPADGVRVDGIVLRLPTDDDVDLTARAFADEEIASRANFPPWTPAELRVFVRTRLAGAVASGAIIPTLIIDAETGETLGGASIQNVDLERSVADIGYWLLPEARGHGVATRAARALADFGFSLGLQRIQAYVNVGNIESERVLERAGFTRERVLTAMPRQGRPPVDQTMFSLTAGE
jgi:RimJ/RimL family protein N-acetyltransferase